MCPLAAPLSEHTGALSHVLLPHFAGQECRERVNSLTWSPCIPHQGSSHGVRFTLVTLCQCSIIHATKCYADYGTAIGGATCCGQPGSVADAQYVCAAEAPVCHGHVHNPGVSFEYGQCSIAQCAADYGTPIGGALCCGQPGTIQNTQYICTSETPFCEGMVHDPGVSITYGLCTSPQCYADYGTAKWGDLCCGQPGSVSDTQYVCPAEAPVCQGAVHNPGVSITYGRCRAVSTGSNLGQSASTSDSSTGIIIGAAVGGVALVGAVVIGVWCMKRRAKHNGEPIVTVIKTRAVQMTSSTLADTHPTDKI